MTLFKQVLKREWLAWLIWSLSMGGLIFYMVVMWKQMDRVSMHQLEQLMQSMPRELAALYGAGIPITTISGWVQAYIFGSWVSLLYLIYTGLFVVGMVTREMDRRTMEFLLSLPVARWELLLSRWAALAVALTALHAVHLASVVAGLNVIGETVPMAAMLWAELNSLVLFLALGGILLVISLFIDDYGPGVGATLGVGFGFYLLHSVLAGAEGGMARLRDALPFAFYDPVAVIGQGEVPAGDLGVLAAVAVVTLALSVWLFQRKQIAV